MIAEAWKVYVAAGGAQQEAGGPPQEANSAPVPS
jgi:hypothetical protein